MVQKSKEVCRVWKGSQEKGSLKGTWQDRSGLSSVPKQTCGTMSFGLTWMHLAIMHSAMFGEQPNSWYQLSALVEGWWSGLFFWVTGPGHLALDQSISQSILQSDVKSSVLWPKHDLNFSHANWSSKTEKSKSRPEHDWRTAAGPKESCAWRNAH